MIWSLAAVVAVALIAALAFLAAQYAGRQPQTIVLREPQAGSQAVVRLGDRLQVSLDANPSTGYGWSLVELDGAVLKLVGEPEFHPASAALGAGGTVTYQFEAIGAGQTALKLTYSRSFEKGVRPLKTFAVDVLVTR
jgi:inhibitor of cysteine peptidase